MSKREKRLRKIRQNPKTVTFEELRTVLEDLGFEFERSTGSHFHFRVVIEGAQHRISIPFRRPYLLPVYVKRALQLMDELQVPDLPGEDEDDE
ncbi:type II toxin-antitoxin system HicA family toxin [bacterium]|nr:type II toxin-antitoxin system HicA family toxin [bacterium]